MKNFRNKNDLPNIQILNAPYKHQKLENVIGATYKYE